MSIVVLHHCEKLIPFGGAYSILPDMAPQLASAEESRENRIALGWRDNCSALLIPLQKCRHATLYAPWKCSDERHSYEKCQYDDFVDRMKQLSQQKQETLTDE